MTKRILALAVAASLAAAGMSACSADDPESGDTTLVVFAAASLTNTFTQIGKKFEDEHDGVTVTFSFGGSSDLVAQIQQGAGADVFASADTANMDKATGDDLVAGEPVDFATNTLEIATPPDNPAGIASFQDLAKPGLKLVVCAPEVPCGAAATKVADSAQITLEPVSEEQSVTDVLGKVESGEADAGLVYVTDVLGAGDQVQGIPFPESDAAVNTYPIAALADSDHAELAEQFVEFVTGSTGQAMLKAAGFGTP
ncbi:MAG: molybdate ABC transporter substrate-binding protein [Nocardioidaceae bacterium]